MGSEVQDRPRESPTLTWRDDWVRSTETLLQLAQVVVAVVVAPLLSVLVVLPVEALVVALLLLVLPLPVVNILVVIVVEVVKFVKVVQVIEVVVGQVVDQGRVGPQVGRDGVAEDVNAAAELLVAVAAAVAAEQAVVKSGTVSS